MNVSKKLLVDKSVYGHHIVKIIWPNSLREKIWCAWKVLAGEAFVSVRFNPEMKFLQTEDKK